MKVLLLVLSLIANPYAREGISLDGKWQAIVDQYDTGLGKKLYLDRQPASKTEFLEYSWTGGLQLEVPGDWNHQEESLRWYEGTVWYSRHFQASCEEGRRRILYFAGVSMRCSVWLNGEKVAEHDGSFTPFEADVTDILREGDNFLALQVDNKRRQEAIPALSFDWWNYGGITREVMLLSMPGVYVSDYFVRLQKGTKDRIEAEIRLSSGTAGQDVILEIPALKMKGKLTTDAGGRATGVFKARNLRLWAPLDPSLYEVRITAGEDVVIDQIGFRDIATAGTKILVNGKETFLKSISFHEEIPMEKRRAVSREDAMTLVDAALELGCNTIRLAHYPQSEHIVRYAEEKL